MNRSDLRVQLRQEFSPEMWRELLPQLFPGAAFFQIPQEVTPDGNVAKSIRQTGFLPLGDGNRLGLFEVEIANAHTVIARNRVGLRALVAKLVDQATIHGALAFFHRPGSSDYRLSFITKQSSFTTAGSLQVTESAPKRYSYVLGPGEPCTTAMHRLWEWLDRRERPTLDSVTKAFSVTRVTREFYKEIEASHSALKQQLNQLKHTEGFEESRVRAQFATRLLGRLVFLRFLAKKRIVEESFFDPETPRHEPYYQKTLGPLFFETLNTPKADRRADLPSDFAKIPYLNGGLFEPNPHDGWPNDSFHIRPDWFKSLFTTFQNYNFTVDENSLQDVEIAVDPEMLGQIFENLLATENTATGQSARDAHGTFYTPREVVDYLCRQSLRLRLKRLHPALIEADLDALLTLEPAHELPKLSVERGSIIRSLDSLKIFDPAVGSGAFPIGMLHALAGVYERLDERFDAYKIKLKVIKNNLYGADIEPMAIELAKLRCWLSLMVETDSIRVPPLPNLDLKFFCLNTLFDPPKLDTEDILLQSDLVDLDALEHDFFACSAKDKPIKRLAIGRKLDELYQGIRSQYVRKALKSGPQTKKIKGVVSEAEAYPESKTLFQDWLQDGTHHLPFFPKELLCPDVFPLGAISKGTFLGNFAIINQLQGQGEFVPFVPPQRGFDIIVANPPFVRHESIKEFKSRLRHYECYTGTSDLYVYFYERSVKLLKEGGVLAFISSNSFLNSDFGTSLRKYLALNTTLEVLIDFAETRVFKAITEPLIILTSRISSGNNAFRALKWEESSPVEEIDDVVRQSSFIINQSELDERMWRIERPEILALLNKLSERNTTMGEYIGGRLYYGIKTGLNDAFVVDGETRDRLISEHASSKDILKPFLRGRDVERWRVEFNDWYLIKLESSENKVHEWSDKSETDAWRIFGMTYPAIQRFMNNLKNEKLNEPDKRGCKNKFEQLQRRDDQGKYFWELRSCVYWQEFERPKILYQEINRTDAFAWDEQLHYANNKLFMITGSSLYLLAILSSRVSSFFIHKSTGIPKGGFLALQSSVIEPLPIANGTAKQERIIEIVAKYVILHPSFQSIFESLLNALIYELYFPDELHLANLKIFDLVAKEKLPDAENSKAVVAYAHSLVDPNHSIRRALFTLGSLPIVRQIEE